MTTVRVTTRYQGVYAFIVVCPGSGPGFGGGPYSQHLFSMPVYSRTLWGRKRYWKYCLCGERISYDRTRP